MVKLLLLIKTLFLLSLLSTFLYAEESAKSKEEEEMEQLMGMSIQELLDVNIDIKGTMVDIDKRMHPASITVITSEDIRLTPARNIYDLIEVYVPGALWMNHFTGAHLGMRGVIIDQDYKILLLVNGKNMNQQSGAKVELQNWDMDDIERIEIIRGPGSATYGPGAIMGIINIVTKNVDKNGPEVNVKYYHPYNSVTASAAYGFKKENFELYSYGSISKTEGFSPDSYAVHTTPGEGSYGYTGTDDHLAPSAFADDPLDYFRDYDDIPQIKAHLDLKLFEELRLWARYSSSGTALNNGVSAKTRLQTGFDENEDPVFGDFQNLYGYRARYYAFVLENQHEISDFLKSDIMFSYNSQDFERRSRIPKQYSFSLSEDVKEFLGENLKDKNSARQFIYNFAEDEIYGKVAFHFNFFDVFKGVLGGEHSTKRYGSGWGDSSEDLRLSYVISDENSLSYDWFYDQVERYTSRNYGVSPDKAVFVGRGWTTQTYSLFGEAHLAISKQLNILLSARADRRTFSKVHVSPRAAIISKIDDENIVKILLQRSIRMNKAHEQLIQFLATGEESSPEKLDSLELIWDRVISDKFYISSSGFYNELEILGWNGTDRNTSSIGDLSLYGFEVEGKYSDRSVMVGVSHSFTKMRSWKLADNVDRSGISYSDYNEETRKKTMLNSYGNSLNNWSDNVTKMFFRYKKDGFTLHLDSRVYWGFEGAKDGLSLLENSAQDSEYEKDVRETIQDDRDKNVYGADWRLNMSISYDYKGFLLTAYGMNLTEALLSAKRYSYDGGISYESPHRVAFVEEPLTLGVKLGYHF